MSSDTIGRAHASRKKRIFLSYGHDERLTDARQVKVDLERRGHTVWFDEDRLEAGRVWDAAIEQGLQHCDLMVLLMTPHSVRRRDERDPLSTDGYCLNELAAALQRNKVIIPVLLVSLEPDGPPNSICRIQYLDLRNVFPIVADTRAVYRERLQRLFNAVERGELDFEGGQARLQRYLRPLNFDRDIGKHIAHFQGRRWLFDDIQNWLYREPESRVFWLTGRPGVGKTAIAARLCHTKREVLAYHLCKATDDEKRDPSRAVLSIAYQISQHLPQYERALQNLDLEEDFREQNAQTIFEKLVAQPLRDVARTEGPGVVIIDAIDEATRDGRNEIAALVADAWEDAPPWLRLIITSRPDEPEVVAALSRLRPHHLNAHGEQNKKDLSEYLESGLKRLSIAADPGTVHEILDRSEGLFLYVQVVLDELALGNLSIDRVEEFPVGLGGHYRRFFERQFPKQGEYERRIRPMLEIICAQREPLPVSLLKRALHSPADLPSRLNKLGSLFPRTPEHGALETQTVTPFHKSVRDWLTTRSPYQIDLQRGESQLAKTAVAWGQLATVPARLYLLRHGVPHMVNVGQFAQACRLIHRLLRMPQLPDGVTLEQLRLAGLYLCRDLSKCPPDEARSIPADQLVDVAVECGGFDYYTLLPPFRILYAHQAPKWPRLRRKIIGADSWTAAYVVSLVMAESHAKNLPDRVTSEIRDLIASPDIGEQELGLYALKLLEGEPARAMDIARELVASRGFLVRSLLFEFLLTRALLGVDVCELLETAGLWTAYWPYHRAQLTDMAAVQELVRKCPSPFSVEPGVARARREIAATFQSCDELLSSDAIRGVPDLHGLLREYARLPLKLSELEPQLIVPALRRSDAMDRILLVLFSHPAWEVRGAAATIAATLSHRRPEVRALVADWIDHADYRVRYAAIETAYGMRHQDHSLFERAMRSRAGDEHPWVRGLVADCICEWVAKEGRQGHVGRLKQFAPEVIRLLHEKDMWPFESIRSMFRQLRAEGVNALASLGAPIGGLLAAVPNWDVMERAEFHAALDAIVQRPSQR
jgi:hypothetical protein